MGETTAHIALNGQDEAEVKFTVSKIYFQGFYRMISFKKIMSEECFVFILIEFIGHLSFFSIYIPIATANQ